VAPGQILPSGACGGQIGERFGVLMNGSIWFPAGHDIVHGPRENWCAQELAQGDHRRLLQDEIHGRRMVAF